MSYIHPREIAHAKIASTDSIGEERKPKGHVHHMFTEKRRFNQINKILIKGEIKILLLIKEKYFSVSITLFYSNDTISNKGSIFSLPQSLTVGLVTMR